MKEEIRQKTVDYKVYIANDGEVFSSKKKCMVHERLVSGEIKVCPDCHGEGRISEEVEWESYHDGKIEHWTQYPKCELCHGKGYVKAK